jgi:hypothetical protein
MPVGLIVFGDKSHTNLHGTLSLTPIIFTLTLFNRTARNNTGFWWLIGYIPNLLYGKGTADRQSRSDKIQDEHTCYHAYLNHCVGLLDREDLIYVSMDEMLL